MKKLWRWFKSYSAPSIPFPAELLTDAEAQERFKSVSQFILEYQKQFFESFRFSLNVWVVLNSGAALALAQKIMIERNTSTGAFVCFIVFVIGALSSALGLVELSCHAKAVSAVSIDFTMNKKQNYMFFIHALKVKFESVYAKIRLLIFTSYCSLYVSTGYLVLQEAGIL